jgi:DNA polymerase-4
MDATALQRGRLKGLFLKGEDLIDTDEIARQLSLDDPREARPAVETVLDRDRAKSCLQVIGPASAFRCAS